MQILKDLSIKYKILLVAAVSILGFVIYLVYSYSASNANVSHLKEIKSVSLKVLEKMDETIVSSEKVLVLLSDAMSISDSDMIEEADAVVKEINQLYKELSLLQPEIKSSVALCKKQFDDYYSLARPLTVVVVEETIDEEKIPEKAAKVNQLFQAYLLKIKKLRTQRYQKTLQKIDQIVATEEHVVNVGLIIGILSIIIIGSVSFGIASLITSPLFSLINLTQQIQQTGQLTIEGSDLVGKDEIGQISAAYKEFTRRLSENKHLSGLNISK